AVGRGRGAADDRMRGASEKQREGRHGAKWYFHAAELAADRLAAKPGTWPSPCPSMPERGLSFAGNAGRTCSNRATIRSLKFVAEQRAAASIEAVESGLAAQGYIASRQIATAVYLAQQIEKP